MESILCLLTLRYVATIMLLYLMLMPACFSVVYMVAGKLPLHFIFQQVVLVCLDLLGSKLVL